MKLTSNKIVITLILLIFHAICFAQLTVDKEIAIPLNESEDAEIELISLKEEGFLVVKSAINYTERINKLIVTKFDSSFSKIWENSYLFERPFSYTHYYQQEKYLYCLIENKDNTQFKVIRFDISTGEKIVFETNKLTNINVNFFSIVGSKAILGGEYNDRAVVELFSFVDKSIKVLPGIYSNNNKVNDIQVPKDSDSFMVLIKNIKTCSYFIHEYSYEGKPTLVTQIGDKKHIPLSGKILTTANHKNFLIGNYSDQCSTYTVGYYIQPISDNKPTQFYDFADLQNYLNYLTDKRKTRILSRIKDRKEKGKETKFRQRLLLQDLKQTSNGWLMVGEVYYPEYQSPSTFYTSYNRIYRYGNEVFNRFNFSHAFLAEFNTNGELIWNTSINLNRISTFVLNELTQVSFTPNGQVVVAFPENNRISAITLNQEHQVISKESFDLKKFLNADFQVIDASNASLLAWQGHSFIAHGFQKVKFNNQLLPTDAYLISRVSYNLLNDPNKTSE